MLAMENGPFIDDLCRLTRQTWGLLVIFFSSQSVEDCQRIHRPSPTGKEHLHVISSLISRL